MEIVAALCIGVAALYQLVLIAQPLRFLCEHVLVDDDAYYYFRIVRQLAADGRASFDGIHATNGIQLAWTALLLPLARWVPGDVAFLRAALTACVALNVAAGFLLERLARLHSAAAGLVAAVVWSGAMLAGGPTLTGMEYSLDVCVVAASLALAWRLWRSLRELDGRTLALGIALPGLMVWTRLDAAPLALPLWLLLARAVALSADRAGRFRRLAALAVGVLLTGMTYALAAHALAGTWTPISGLAKRHLAAVHFAASGSAVALAGHLFWWLSIPLRGALALIDPWVQLGPLPPRLPSLGGGAVMLAALLLGLRRALRSYVAPGERAAAKALLVASALGAAHAALMVAVLGHFAHVTAHYFAWLAVTFAVAAGFVVARLELPRAGLSAALLVLFALWLGLGVARVARRDDGNLRVRRLALAGWIDRNLSREARIGAWNAGQLGYFSHRAVVSLDGLANDRAYLEFLRSGRPVEKYLEREGIDFLADYDASDLSMPFRFAWDHQILFRGALPWKALEIVRADRAAEPPLYLVRLRRGEG
jgi:hypothetical protein